MVSFLGDFSDLVSSVTTVAKQVGKEVVSDVRGAVHTAQEASKIDAKKAAAAATEAAAQQTTDSTNNNSNNQDIPSSLDLKYATDRILCMPQPTVDAWTAKCYFDQRDHHEVEEIPGFTPDTHPHRNDVTVLAQYLQDQQYCVWNVSDTPAEDTLVQALLGHVIHVPWKSPSAPRSETPSVTALLDICYALHAYLTQHENNMAIIYCANGKTRTAIVVACYLVFCGRQRSVAEGFLYFLQHCQNMSRDQAVALWDTACPPSLHTFGHNFDQTIRLGLYRNPKPLLLRAIALQGIPVEDKPCLDIWDGQQRHIYSSHPELWTDLVDTSVVIEDEECDPNDTTIPVAKQPPLPPMHKQLLTDSSPLKQQALKSPLPILEHNSPYSQSSQLHNHNNHNHHQSQWADEEGFYRVNVVLEGDFCLLCRFGGVHAGSDKDSTKLLFRYANTTTCMGAGGPYELPPQKVDLMRRYASCFDPDDFLCTLLLEAHWNVPEPYWQERLNRNCQSLPPVYEAGDVRVLQRGWQVLQRYCEVQPRPEVVTALLQRYYREATTTATTNTTTTSEDVTDDLAVLCLQQSNLNVDQAFQSLQSIHGDPESPMARLWQTLQAPSRSPQSSPRSLSNPQEEEETQHEEPAALKEATQNVLNILGSVDFGDTFEKPPLLHTPSGTIGPFPLGGDSQENASQQPGHHHPLHASASYVSPFLNAPPRQGDILNAFGEYYQDIHNTGRSSSSHHQSSSLLTNSHKLTMGSSFPQLPLQPAHSATSSSSQRQPHDQLYSPVDDPANASSLELLLKMNHPGITLQDLTRLLQESRHWNKSQPVKDPEPTKDQGQAVNKEEEGVLVAMGTAGVGGAQSAVGVDGDTFVHGPAPPIKDHPEYSKYFKLLKSGKSMEEVKEIMKQDQKDPTIAELDPNQSLSSQRPNMAGQEVVFTTVNAVQNAQKALHDALAQKKDGHKVDIVVPKKEQNETKEEEEENDSKENAQAKLMKALAKNKPTDEAKEEDAPLRTDPDYGKFFKMLKIGMPKEQVQHAMTRDDKDPTIIDLDPERSLKAQRAPKTADGGDDGPPLKEDPDYKKYFKMLKMGMPKEQVAHALQRDDKDPKILDLDPEKPLKSQQPSGVAADTGPPLKDDEEYKKYFKMLKMGMAKEQVAHALQRDGKDPAVLDMDPEKSLASQQKNKAPAVDDDPPLKDDPEYQKYFKMLKMGLPLDAVKNALVRDEKDPSIMDLDHDKSVKSQIGGGGTGAAGEPAKDDGIPLKDDPEYSKYYKMMNMGLPKAAVQNALQRDGKDPGVMDLDPEKSLKFQMGGSGGEEEKDTGVPLKDDPEYVKYFRMQKMGLPKEAVKNALQRDGKDAAIMDLDPDKSVAFQLSKKSGGGIRRTPSKKKGKKVRRKKIYWTPLPPEQIKEDSIWKLVKGSVKMDKLDYDVKEFEDLFTESADPADRKKSKRKKTDEKKQKKSVQVIDGKRSMNGGIILARMKTDYRTIAGAVNEMQHRKFDATQLKALKEFLPTPDERQGLKMYMKKGESDAEVKDQLYKELSECEKYMYTMIDVLKADEKFDCMLFRNQFKIRFEDLIEGLLTVEKACDETRNSEKLRKMMATILTLVNQINTGGEEGKQAEGFSLDALLKLNEAKAFDKKTSVLTYLAKLVKKNDETLLGFQEDLPSVRHAENVILDGLASDIKAIESELEQVHKTAAEEAARLEAADELKPFSLTDLKELKTTVHMIDKVQHFNKVEHHSGRTPMERFALNTQEALKQANGKIDDLKKKYASLLEYFGEDSKMPSNEFFGVMRKFIEEFEKACDEVDKLDQERVKQEKREAKRIQQEKVKEEKLAAKKASRLASKPVLGMLASKKATLTEDSEGDQDTNAARPGSAGGIASLAALAASKKKQQATADATTASIGSLAAMAAASKKKQDGTSGVGGIAGLAAAAAQRKKDGNDQPGTKRTSDDKQTAGVGMGLAAMAAAAAAKKKGEESSGASGGSSIAGLAALAAKKKQDGDADKSDAAAGANTSIASLAALAAKKKQGSDEDTSGAASGTNTSIGSLAALAAKKKQGDDSESSPGENSKASGGGGASIASLAALAAEKNKAKPPSNDSEDAEPGGGGASIASLAALAAQKHQASNEKSSASKPTDELETPKEAAGNSIASLAALAAAQKKKAGSEELSGTPSVDNESPTTASGGSLASLAALAAQKKQGRDGDGAGESKSAPDVGGGLAAMASAARSAKEESAVDAKPEPASRGLSAAVSDTPRKRKVYDDKGGLYHSPPSEGNSRQLATFSAEPSDTLFHLGSSDKEYSGRGLPLRSKTVNVPGFNRRPLRRNKTGDGSILRVRRSKSGSTSSTTNDGSSVPGSSTFPPNKNSNADGAPAVVKRASSHGSVERNTGSTAAFASSSPADDFMASLGFTNPEGENSTERTLSSPSVLFAMRRTQRVRGSDEDDGPSLPRRQSSDSSRKTVN